MTSWHFLLALLLLVVNDGYLKYEFPGLISGKLSDFAGLYVVSILLFSLVPRQNLVFGIVIAACFVIWKSPWSQPLINFVNSLVSVQFGRVIDYSDLLALIVIPIAARSSASRSRPINSSFMRRLAVIPIAMLTVGAITGTSVMMATDEYSLRNANENEPLTAVQILSVITSVSNAYGLTCDSCSPVAKEGRFAGKDLSLLYWLEPENNGVRIVVDGHKTKGWLLPGPDYEILEEFRNALKSEFSTLGADMEYVESL